MTVETLVGSSVWERTHPLADHAARGGTVVEFDPGDGAEQLPRVRVVTGTPRSVSRGRETYRVTTAWLNLEDLDPGLTAAWNLRAADRYRLGHRILRAVSDRAGQPGAFHYTMLRWVVGLWLGPGGPPTLPVFTYDPPGED